MDPSPMQIANRLYWPSSVIRFQHPGPYPNRYDRTPEVGDLLMAVNDYVHRVLVASQCVLSANMGRRMAPGLASYLAEPPPVCPGVVLQFVFRNQAMTITCDCYDTLRGNLLGLVDILKAFYTLHSSLLLLIDPKVSIALCRLYGPLGAVGERWQDHPAGPRGPAAGEGSSSADPFWGAFNSFSDEELLKRMRRSAGMGGASPFSRPFYSPEGAHESPFEWDDTSEPDVDQWKTREHMKRMQQQADSARFTFDSSQFTEAQARANLDAMFEAMNNASRQRRQQRQQPPPPDSDMFTKGAMIDYRTILQLPATGTITKADLVLRYRLLAKLYHPDGQQPNEEKFKQVAAAYEYACKLFPNP